MLDKEGMERPLDELTSPIEETEAEKDLELDEIATENSNLESIPKYQASQRTRSGNIIAPLGDNSHITINYFQTIIRDAEKWSLYESDESEDSVTATSTEDLIKQNLAFERQNTPHFDTTLPQAHSEQRELPKGISGLSKWYYMLNEYEQCYVQATAILHGASAHEISKRADKLYQALQSYIEQHEAVVKSVPQRDMQQEPLQEHIRRIPLHKQPSLELRKHTYTTTRRVKGVERIFWQDVDNYGLSQFGPYVLTFLTNEFISKGEHGEGFFNVIQSWSQEKKGESYWRAARALGGVLWYKDIHQLRKQANEWAKRRSIHGRRQAASLLDGAREIELITLQIQADDVSNSLVLQLLNEWIDQAHKELNKINTNLGCTVAHTFGLIGKKSPGIALQGLRRLLEIQQNEDTEEFRNLFAAGISTYISLTWAGNMRDVLKFLADTAEQLTLQWSLPRALEKRQSYRLQREALLNATFEAFFLVAAAASPEELNDEPNKYTQALPTQIPIPDLLARDVLLVAILTRDSVREHLLTLLCAAIVTSSGKPTFELIRHWTETVIIFQQIPDLLSTQLYSTFIEFLVDLGHTIKRWCRNLTTRGYRTPGAGDVYHYKLMQWEKEGVARKRAIGQLAHQVLSNLL